MRAPQARRRVLLSCPDGVTGAALLQALRRGDRRALARAITLVESSRPDHRGEAERIIEALLPETGKAVRIGISGPPGAGKSTFIERFGLAGIALGRRIAVLAVDPASKRGGGAILGDKTRMAELARAPEAFIRPSSAGHTPGGIARRTREAILLCEAAGFDAILVETVGVGQAETAVAELVDMFVLILSPAGGKADGELAAAAQRTVADYASAMGLIRPPYPEWQVPVRAVSALEGAGIREVWEDVNRFHNALEHTGAWTRRRTEQARAALWSEIGDSLLDHFRAAPGVAQHLAAVEEEVMAGTRTPTAAARELLMLFVREACEGSVPRRRTGLTKRGRKA